MRWLLLAGWVACVLSAGCGKLAMVTVGPDAEAPSAPPSDGGDGWTSPTKGPDAAPPRHPADAADASRAFDSTVPPHDSAVPDVVPARDASAPDAPVDAAPPACTIEGVSYASGQLDPVNPCWVCAPQSSSFLWTILPDGTSCGSGGTCQHGTCAVCPSICQVDSDCQSQCPGAPAGAANCCDTAIGICFVSTTAQCPGAVSCPSTCTTDTECQSQCPAQAGSLMCCDTPFSYCYASGVPFCPHPGACPATCTTDTECQSQCPANDAGATVCCDTGSGQCYQSGSSVCPQDVACGAPCVTEADCQSMCPTPRPGHVDCCMQGSCFYVVDGGCPVSPYP